MRGFGEDREIHECSIGAGLNLWGHFDGRSSFPDAQEVENVWIPRVTGADLDCLLQGDL